MPRPAVPNSLAGWMMPFEGFFTRPTWCKVLVLIAGAVLSPGRRTVTAALSVMGLREAGDFSNFHRVLNRNRWSGRAVARCLLGRLIAVFVPEGPVVVGIDETIERRWGARITARGIYRDPVRSSRGHFVKASGLRWIAVMLLAPIPWAGRVWALPFLTALAPSERAGQKAGRRHKTLTERARQMMLLVARWLPGRQVVVVADSSYAAIDLLAAVRPRLAVVTRLRLDARLFEFAPPRETGKRGRPRTKGAPQPSLTRRLADPATPWRRVRVDGWYGGGERTLEIASGAALWHHPGKQVPVLWILVRDSEGEFETQAFVCTDLQADPLDALRWFVRRWAVEVTFAEVRRHLGVETQRQWSDPAIERTTPALLGLFSLVTLWAHEMADRGTLLPRPAAWYQKGKPTFSDALATVRRRLWNELITGTSPQGTDVQKIPNSAVQSLIQAACFPA